MLILYWLLIVANGAAFGSFFAGWLAVPVVALVGAWFAPRGAHPLVTVPLGCVLGWAALLLRSARADGFSALLDITRKMLPVPPAALIGATLGLALLLGLGAALIGTAFQRPPVHDR